jgi:uncharacterized membrane protein YgcG
MGQTIVTLHLAEDEVLMLQRVVCSGVLGGSAATRTSLIDVIGKAAKIVRRRRATTITINQKQEMTTDGEADGGRRGSSEAASGRDAGNGRTGRGRAARNPGGPDAPDQTDVDAPAK